MKKALVVGAGAWGSAIADLISHNLNEVLLFDRDPIKVAQINEGSSFFGTPFDPKVRGIEDLKDINIDIIFLVTPSGAVLDAVHALSESLTSIPPIVICTKGMAGAEAQTFSEVISHKFPTINPANIGVLSGPNYAAQVFERLPTIATLAFSDQSVAQAVAQICTTSYFTVEITDDVRGIQIIGAYKNVMAIACGIAQGLGYQANAISKLIMVAISDLKVLLETYKAHQDTLLLAAGFGDIYLTCAYNDSRNYTYGYLVSTKGVGPANSSNITVEGVSAVQAFKKIAEARGVHLVVAETLFRIIFEEASPSAELLQSITA